MRKPLQKHLNEVVPSAHSAFLSHGLSEQKVVCLVIRSLAKLTGKLERLALNHIMIELCGSFVTQPVNKMMKFPVLRSLAKLLTSISLSVDRRQLNLISSEKSHIDEIR